MEESTSESQVVTVELTVEDEFYLVAGIVLNNWFAIQVGMNESGRGPLRNKQIEDVFWTAYNSIVAFKNKECSLEDAIDYLDDCMVMDMDIVLEDGSHRDIMNSLNALYDLVVENNHAEIARRLNTLSNRSHLLNREVIDFSKLNVIRKDRTTRPLILQGTGPVKAAQQTHVNPMGDSDRSGDEMVMECEEESSGPQESSMETNEKPSLPKEHDEWMTVTKRKSRR